MKIKNPLLGLACFVAVFSIGYVWLKQLPRKRQSLIVAETPPSPTPFKEVVVKKGPVFATGSPPDTERNANYVNKMQQITKSLLETKIDFYGKVIDEHGKPIAGAITSYIVTTMSMTGNPTIGGPTSDADGRFSITGIHGPQLFVKVEHPSYYPTGQARQRFTYAGPVADNAPAIPTADAPAVFVLKSKGNAELLIHKTLKTRLPVDGSPVSVDVNAGAVGEGDYSIVFTLQSEGRKLPINEYSPFDWKLAITVPGGGVQERNDKLQFTAPIGGYVNKLEYAKAATLPRAEWKGTFDKDFFVQLPSKAYGRFHLHVAAKSGSCEIDSFVNPDPKSMNLEYGADSASSARQ